MWTLAPAARVPELVPHTPVVSYVGISSKITDNRVKENGRIGTKYNQILGLRDLPFVNELVFRSNISMD